MEIGGGIQDKASDVTYSSTKQKIAVRFGARAWKGDDFLVKWDKNNLLATFGATVDLGITFDDSYTFESSSRTWFALGAAAERSLKFSEGMECGDNVGGRSLIWYRCWCRLQYWSRWIHHNYLIKHVNMDL